MDLNTKQKRAVNHEKGPIIVIAGAGTGKTRVITERICRLMSEKKAKAEEILAVTFTEKASGEMLERVDKSMPYGYGDLWVMTFHGLCDRILKESAIHIGFSPAYQLMTYPMQIALLRKNLFKKFKLDYFRPLNNPYRFLDALIKHVSRLQDEDVSPAEYLEYAKTREKTDEVQQLEAKKTMELAQFYQTYQDLKRDCNVMDFGDLIYYTLMLFKKRQNVLREYQSRFKYILVDEFQDTNFTQNEIAILLAAPENNIMVVGDDDQAIYRFRGASISNIMQFKERFPKAKEVVLVENYRSNQEILDGAYRVISHNNPYRLEVEAGVDKRLVSRCSSGDKKKEVEIFRFHREFDEADFVAQKIMELAGYKLNEKTGEVEAKKAEGVNKKLNFEDIAVLVRAHSHLSLIVDRLRFYGIPFQFAGTSDLFNRPVVKDMMALLRVLNDREDNLSMYRVASFGGFALPQKTLSELSRQSRYSGESLYSMLREFVMRIGTETTKVSENSGAVDNLSFLKKDGGRADLARKSDAKSAQTNGSQRLKALFDSVDNLNFDKVQKTGLSATLFNILKQTDYVTVLEVEKGDQVGLASLYEFLNLVKSYEGDSSEPLYETLEFLENIESLGGVDQRDLDIVQSKGVQLMTVHGAKGLEFKTVIIPALVKDRFPSRRMGEPIPVPDKMIKEVLPDEDPHLQEERRLFYVGATRAEQKLILTFSDYYSEGKQLRQPSTFLAELLGEDGLSKLKEMEYGKPADFLGAEPKVEPETQTVNYLPKQVSFSQLDVYNKCPMQYYFSYVLGLRAPPSAVLSFGNTVHSALKKFYELHRAHILEKARKPQGEDLIGFYEESWISAGYKSRQYEEKRKESGRVALTNYYNNMYSQDERPVKLEEGFRVQIGDVSVVGKVDRVDFVAVADEGKGAEKTGKKARIIDYKTGADKDKIEEHEKLQLAIYAFAIKDRWGWDPVSMAIVRVEGGREIEMEWDEKWLDKAKEFVLNTVRRIGTKGFPARPGFLCEYCDYRNICNWSKR